MKSGATAISHACGAERITGPWAGIFIAAYTAELDGRFYGYAKLCVDPPSDVWTAKAMVKISADSKCASKEALQAAENRALRVICAMRAPANRARWLMKSS